MKSVLFIFKLRGPLKIHFLEEPVLFVELWNQNTEQ